MRRLWIIFSQTATICLAVLFVVATLKPEWLPTRATLPAIAVMQQEAPAAGAVAPRADSHHTAVKKAMPSVVNISTSKELQLPRNAATTRIVVSLPFHSSLCAARRQVTGFIFLDSAWR